MRILVPVMIVGIIVVGILVFQMLSRKATERRKIVAELQRENAELTRDNGRLWAGIDAARDAASVYDNVGVEAVVSYLPHSSDRKAIQR